MGQPGYCLLFESEMSTFLGQHSIVIALVFLLNLTTPKPAALVVSLSWFSSGSGLATASMVSLLPSPSKNSPRYSGISGSGFLPRSRGAHHRRERLAIDGTQ